MLLLETRKNENGLAEVKHHFKLYFYESLVKKERERKKRESGDSKGVREWSERVRERRMYLLVATNMRE